MEETTSAHVNDMLDLLNHFSSTVSEAMNTILTSESDGLKLSLENSKRALEEEIAHNQQRLQMLHDGLEAIKTNPTNAAKPDSAPIESVVSPSKSSETLKPVMKSTRNAFFVDPSEEDEMNPSEGVFIN
jgi:hypothetical protein